MILKRLLAGVLIMLMIPCAFMLDVGATLQSETASAPTEEETEAPTKPPVTAKDVGIDKYVKLLEKTCFTGELGAIYSKKSTTFRLWTPLATNVKVRIYSKGSEGEDGNQMISETSMKLSKKNGVWQTTLKGDYKNKYYTYLVTVNGKTNEVVDPYAKACGANGDRGMVVDLSSTNPEGWKEDNFNRVSSMTDAVIWEVSVRDFSASDNSGVSEKNRGKFLAFTEEGTVVDSVEGSLPTCIDYLKDLGVNYVQINPFYDFHSIDETDTVNPQYNWGYDPKNYNIPEGSYSSDPYNGNVRIKECKQMIQALHKAGIGVIMDVVYNHTYLSSDSWFNLIVPDYYYRIDSSGNWSNGSGCGNDTASERVMFRKFMIDSVVYWAKEYHIDGFRFDLMGLHDVTTMNSIRKGLDALPNGNRILMYGEAWELDTNCASNVVLANQNNLSKLSTRIGAFNDTIRDGIKGNVFDAKDKGFIQSGSNKAKVKSGIEGMATAGTWGTPSRMCVNYASCHDNLSLYDKLVDSVYPDEGSYRKRREDLVSMNKLSAAIILTSQGVPFMMAGEEMARSKDGDENSYKSPVEVNQIDWNDINKYADLTEYYKGLIDIRQTVDLLRDGTGDVAKSISYLSGLDDGVIAYTIKGTGNTKAFAAVFNGSDKATTVTLPDGLCLSWVIVANDKDAGVRNLGEVKDSKVTVQPHSCALLVNKSSFDAYENIDTTKRVVVKYFDTESQSVIYEQVLKGNIGDSYSVSYPNQLVYRYDVSGYSGSKSGKFTNKTQEITIDCVEYDGDYSSVTIHYLDENGDDIANSVVMTNRVGQRYTTVRIAGIEGYRLDLERLPENGAGKFEKDDITVNFYYKPIEISEGDSIEALNTCVANVIYMSESGEILETKSYAGEIGTEIVVEYLEIPDYAYISDTAASAVFDTVETNIVVNYEKYTKALSVAVIVGCGLLFVLLIAGVVLVVKRRKSGAGGYSDADDLFIE